MNAVRAPNFQVVFPYPRPGQNRPGTFISSGCSESSEKDRLLFVFYFLDTKFLWPRKHFSHIPGPTLCPYCHFSSHRSHTPFCFNASPGHLQGLGFCGFGRLAEVWQMGKIKIFRLPLTPCWLVIVRGKVCVEWTTCVPRALPDCWECW